MKFVIKANKKETFFLTLLAFAEKGKFDPGFVEFYPIEGASDRIVAEVPNNVADRLSPEQIERLKVT